MHKVSPLRHGFPSYLSPQPWIHFWWKQTVRGRSETTNSLSQHNIVLTNELLVATVDCYRIYEWMNNNLKTFMDLTENIEAFWNLDGRHALIISKNWEIETIWKDFSMMDQHYNFFERLVSSQWIVNIWKNISILHQSTKKLKFWPECWSASIW
jgi:hypothetical protein